jgi:hypothetical protein
MDILKGQESISFHTSNNFDDVERMDMAEFLHFTNYIPKLIEEEQKIILQLLGKIK